MNYQYDILYIQEYLEGKLSPEQMYELERAALDDALLQDAIDGYRSTEKVDHLQLSLLQKRLATRIETHQESKSQFYFTWQRLAIASVSGLLFIVIGILFWMMRSPNSNQSSQASQATTVRVESKVAAGLIEGNLSPKVGWSAFRDYVSMANLPAAAGDRVVVRLDLEGSRPSDIQFVSEHSAELIAAVKKMLIEGPTWEGSSGTLELQF